MIRQAEISKIAYHLRLGEKTIEKDYVLTWVLIAIANSPLKDLLAFKGGTAIKKIYVPDYRFSEDLDFTLIGEDISNDLLVKHLGDLYPWLLRQANIQLAMDHLDEHKSSNFAVYLNYSGPLNAQLDKRALKIDFSRDEVLVFPLVNRPVKAQYSDCTQEKANITAYTMEEILSEKLRSLLTRSEPRDLFDVHYIMTHQMADVDAIAFRCVPKFEIKGLHMEDLGTVLVRKQKVFKQYWHSRLDGQLPEIPEFDEVLRETGRLLARNFR